MSQCDVCLRTFNSQWELRRHQKRKFPCSESDRPSSNISEQMTSEHFAEESLQNNTTNRCDKECKYCKFKFTAAYSARRHEQHCKEDHAVRRLEIKMGLSLERYHEKDCRFCKKTFTRRQSMILHQKRCPAKERCMEALTEKYKKENCKIVNNVTINNVTNVKNENCQFNVVVNSIDRTDRIMRELPEKVARWLIHDQRQNSGNMNDWRTGMKMILQTHEKPENRNMKVTNDRSNVIWCYDGERDVARVADGVIEEEFQQCVDDLLHMKQKHCNTLCKLGALRELERYIDTISTQEHAKHHKKSVMTALKVASSE